MKKDKIADLGRLSMGHAPAELAVCGEKPLQNSTASNMHACAGSTGEPSLGKQTGPILLADSFRIL